MPSCPARRRAWLVAIAAAILALLPAGCAQDTSLDPPKPSTAAEGAQAFDRAQETVAALQSALADGDGAAASDLGSGSAATALRAAARNVGLLGISGLSLRLIDGAVAAPSAGPAGSWRGVVEARYRLRRWDQGATRLEVPMSFAPDSGGAMSISSIGGPGGRAPLWLRGAVRARAGDRYLVIDRSGGDRAYAAMARRALRDVAAVLPRWRGSLVLEVPAAESELDEALDAEQAQYANIAAVTASVDGTLSAAAPVHVYLNPRVFGSLGPRGSQVVISHETTHVATDATLADMPVWLLEGFADYVALAHAGVPISVAAGQILAEVRQDGPPERLPTAEDLSPTADGLGATYEEAWLATRYIAAEYGEDALVRFYFEVDGGMEAAEAFGKVLGTTEAAFVRRWSADVAALSRRVPGGAGAARGAAR